MSNFFNLKLYKKNLKKIFHILPTCFKKMHIYLQKFDVLK